MMKDSPTLKQDNLLVLDALQGLNKGRAPIWLMRQAGRYMPAYQAVKRGKELVELFRNKDSIVEITMQPIDILGVDAAIVFSDILIILDAFGIDYTFQEKVGPLISKPFDLKQVDSFNVEDKLSFLFEAMKQLSSDLNVPLLGFAGAPFTVASYLIEGGSSRDFKKVKKWIYSDPESFYHLLDRLSDAIALFLDKQIEAGASAVQLFDSWANILSHHDFHKYSLGFVKKILEKRIYKDVPLIYFCRGAGHFSKEIAALGVSCISVDWTTNLKMLRRGLKEVSFQGNLDPALFYGSIKNLQAEASRILTEMKGDGGFIFNLGHGIPPDAPFEKVKFLVEVVKQWQE